MNADGIWRLFCETGDPACYLAYKELEKARDKKQERDNDPRTDIYGQANVNM